LRNFGNDLQRIGGAIAYGRALARKEKEVKEKVAKRRFDV